MQKKAPIRERFNNKLLVEGKDEQHLIWSLCEKFQVKETFDVVDLEGLPNLLEDILVRPKAQSDLSCLGIVVDVDDNISQRWTQIKARLTKSGYTIPDKPDPKGTVVETPGLPKVGIWLMPNNKDIGMVEDFIRLLVADDDDSLAFAEDTIRNLENKNLQKYIPNHRPKALIHTWLAWQKNPGTPLGQAVTKKYLTTDKELCQQFIHWLNRVFNT